MEAIIADVYKVYIECLFILLKCHTIVTTITQLNQRLILVLPILAALALATVHVGATQFDWQQNVPSSSREFAGVTALGANITGASAFLSVPAVNFSNGELDAFSKFVVGYWIGLNGPNLFVQAGFIPIFTTEEEGNQVIYNFVGWESFFMYLKGQAYIWPLGNVTFYSQGFLPSTVKGLVDATEIVQGTGENVNVTLEEVGAKVEAFVNNSIVGEVDVNGNFTEALFELEMYPAVYPNGTVSEAYPPVFPNITFLHMEIREGNVWSPPVALAGPQRPLGIGVLYTNYDMTIYRIPPPIPPNPSPAPLRHVLLPVSLAATICLFYFTFPRRKMG